MKFSSEQAFAVVFFLILSFSKPQLFKSHRKLLHPLTPLRIFHKRNGSNTQASKLALGDQDKKARQKGKNKRSLQFVQGHLTTLRVVCAMDVKETIPLHR